MDRDPSTILLDRPGLGSGTSKASLAEIYMSTTEKYSAMKQCLVLVRSTLSFSVDGLRKGERGGTGVIVYSDVSITLVLVARTVVPSDACQVRVTTGDNTADAKIKMEHPSKPIAVIEYPTSSNSSTKVRTAQFQTRRIYEGEPLFFMGYGRGGALIADETNASQTSTITFRISAPPSYRPFNIDAFTISPSFEEQCTTGILFGADGSVCALSLKIDNNFFAFPASSFSSLVKSMQAGEMPQLRPPLAELEMTHGDDEKRLDGLASIKVRSTFPWYSGFRQNDTLLSVGFKPIYNLAALDPDKLWSHELEQRVKIIRGKDEMAVDISAMEREIETGEITQFRGATFQKPHLAVRLQGRPIPSDIYVSHIDEKSPARSSKLMEGCFITSVNGQPLVKYEVFQQAIMQIQHNEGTCVFVLSLLKSSVDHL